MASHSNHDDDTQVTEAGEYQINVTTAPYDRNPSQGSELMTLDVSELQATVWIMTPFFSMTEQPWYCQSSFPFGTSDP